MPIDIVKSLKSRVFEISSHQEFNDVALEIFHFQSNNNPVYSRFLNLLNRPTPKIWNDIPCLPISAFKTHDVKSTDRPAEMVFRSSGTSGTGDSSHHISDVSIYQESFRSGFEKFYGPVNEYCVFGLLPSYLERKDSSLVYMVADMIKESAHSESGFFLDDHLALKERLIDLEKSKQKTLLIGVTYALLDFVDENPISFPELIVMETGGMKGRRKELVRDEVHRQLKLGFSVKKIHSEYGMTELLSQAYSSGEGKFLTPPWMNVAVRDIHDPLSIIDDGSSGGLNIFDLANIESCSFIATDDLGRKQRDGSFEVLGRYDASDIRGCSLMV